MSRYRRVIAYATGCLPFRDGMLLEDYLDAVAFRSYDRIPKSSHWVDELREQAALARF